MKLGIDLDGCVYNFTAEAAQACAPVLNRTTRDLLSTFDNFTWDFFKHDWGMDPEHFWEVIYEAVEAGEVWCKGEPMPGSLEALATLRDMGHSIHIVTHRTGAERATVNWLIENEVPHDSITITKDKTIANVDLFIDDYEGNWAALNEAGIPCVLMDQPWNRHVTDAIRMKGWPEFVDYVKRWTP